MPLDTLHQETNPTPSSSVPLQPEQQPASADSQPQKQKKVWDYYSPTPADDEPQPDNQLRPSSSTHSVSSDSHHTNSNNNNNNNNNSNNNNSPKVTSHLTKCDKKSRPQDIPVCCRELRGDDERHLIDPDIVRDVIIGLSDGLTVPFGLTAGLSSLGSSRLVVVGGIAELISGAISMGIGGYLASEAERDHYKYLQKTTKDRVTRSCSGEMEREVHEVLGPIGLDESISRTVAAALLRVETEANHDSSDGTVDPAQEESTARWLLRCLARQPKSSKQIDDPNHQLRWAKDVGITAFLLKFSEGLEEVPESRLYISALTIGLSYFIGGLVPMAPYFFIESAQIALYWSIAIMFITLLIFGVFKAYFTGAKIGFTGYLKASSATIVVGGAAAAASWLIVKALEKH
ncbi:hypothetical protein PCANC_04204 [Puccinia coronata f. sp. avenae]|uniref:DUF125-domain-containing protein n=1 Tax=Puccinia coronata f. sp. avenae TaxID=200324 RepID=A0A2N5VX36_9BASI|nr:hypothetical protein PCASD_04470 [Puccinia coronata f. sp. avenae]PLW54555.1 hypothetical protein PCANC_04204 [Puccinia coronata f. sp. avenae]